MDALTRRAIPGVRLWDSSWISHLLLPEAWLCFSPPQDGPASPHITAHAILLELEGEKSKIRDGALHLLLLLWLLSPCIGDFCSPSSSDFSIHFPACDS